MRKDILGLLGLQDFKTPQNKIWPYGSYGTPTL